MKKGLFNRKVLVVDLLAEPFVVLYLILEVAFTLEASLVVGIGEELAAPPVDLRQQRVRSDFVDSRRPAHLQASSVPQRSGLLDLVQPLRSVLELARPQHRVIRVVAPVVILEHSGFDVDRGAEDGVRVVRALLESVTVYVLQVLKREWRGRAYLIGSTSSLVHKRPRQRQSDLGEGISA